MNDAYQPIEKEIEHTRKVLKIIEKYKFPLNIATKSNLVVRDIDILKNIAIDTWSTVGFSITTTNEELASFLEPNSSPPSERFEAIKTIKMQAPNIQVGTYLMPIIPFLEDDHENLEDVIKQSKDSGADFVLFSPGLTLRDSQADYFLKKLRSGKYNKAVKPILELYMGQIHPPVEYVRKLHIKLLNICEKYDMSVRVKRWIPSDYRRWNYKISELLLNKEYMDTLRTGKSNKNLKWAGLNLNNLDESILDVFKRGELSQIKNFTNKIVEEVKPYLEKTKELKQKIGLEKFL